MFFVYLGFTVMAGLVAGLAISYYIQRERAESWKRSAEWWEAEAKDKRDGWVHQEVRGMVKASPEFKRTLADIAGMLDEDMWKLKDEVRKWRAKSINQSLHLMRQTVKLYHPAHKYYLFLRNVSET